MDPYKRLFHHNRIGLQIYAHSREKKSNVYMQKWVHTMYPILGGIISTRRKDAMKKEVYQTPKLEKVGNVKELTRGGTGVHPDAGNAGSYSIT